MGQNGKILTKKLPNLAEPDFCQHIHYVIIVIEHYGSFHSKNRANHMTRLGGMCPKGHFWSKMAKFEPQMTKTGFFDKNLKMSLPYTFFFYKQMICLGVRVDFGQKVKQIAKQMPGLKFGLGKK